MEISYEEEALRNLYRFPAKALARFGPKVARALAVRFADLLALENAGKLSVFVPKYQTVCGGPALKLDLGEEFSITLVAVRPKIPPTTPATWDTLKRLKVFEVVGKNE